MERSGNGDHVGGLEGRKARRLAFRGPGQEAVGTSVTQACRGGGS